MSDGIEQYRFEPEAFWLTLQMRSLGGYGRMDVARQHGWKPIAHWGLEGSALGVWPLVVVYHRDGTEGFALAVNVECEVAAYRFPSRNLRDAATDEVAFFYWKQKGEPWVEGIASAAEMPDHLRGRFKWSRIQAERARGQELPVTWSVPQSSEQDLE